MQYYIILTVSTAIIAGLAIILWARLRDISFPLGIALLYYWTLFGAWFIVKDKLGHRSDVRYSYLEAKLFAVNLDDSYLLTLILYSIFIVVIEASLLLLVKKGGKRCQTISRPLRISHWIILAIGASAGIVSFLIIQPGLEAAKEINMSPYKVLSAFAPTGEGGGLIPAHIYTIHQLLFQTSLLLSLIGFVIFCSGKRPRLLAGRGGPSCGIAYSFVLGGLALFSLVIGQKGDLFIPGVAGLLFYLVNAERPRIVVLMCLSVMGLMMLGLINITRYMATSDVASALAVIDIGQLFKAFESIVKSNEAVGAHFSMYGVLAQNVGVTYGSSILSLLASVIPRLFWPNRPETIYGFYVDNVGAAPGQGYSIHHATGWLLNFGIPGVFLGAIILAGIWAGCFNFYLRANVCRKAWRYLFTVLAPWMFVAYIPRLVRAGPEAYKGLILEAFLIPTIALTVASYRWRFFPRTGASGAGRDVCCQKNSLL